MKVRKSCAKTMVLAVLVSSVLLLFGKSVVRAGEPGQCAIIRIQLGEHAVTGSYLELSPQKITVKPGTCVVWVNWVSQYYVRINFAADSHSCMLATEAPSGFKEKGGCYLSGYLPLGQSASLFFKKPGVYTYKLEINPAQKKAGQRYPTRSVPVKGTIEVK